MRKSENLRLSTEFFPARENFFSLRLLLKGNKDSCKMTVRYRNTDTLSRNTGASLFTILPLSICPQILSAPARSFPLLPR